MKRLRWQLFTLLMLTTLGCHASPAPLTLGVHPYLPATELTQRFKPLVD
jgi:hypothetical protein